jgi:hypothetical protein
VIVTRVEAAAAAKDDNGGSRGIDFGDYDLLKVANIEMDILTAHGVVGDMILRLKVRLYLH